MLSEPIWSLRPLAMSQEKCTDIIAFAAAEMADVADGVHSSPCPVLSRLAKADPKKSLLCGFKTVFYDDVRKNIMAISFSLDIALQKSRLLIHQS